MSFPIQSLRVGYQLQYSVVMYQLQEHQYSHCASGTSFSTASFVPASASQPDIDYNDPNFWEKLLPQVCAEIKCEKPRAQYSLYRECGFWI